MIVLLREGADDAQVEDLRSRIAALGFTVMRLDEGKGGALEVTGLVTSPVLGSRGPPAVADILTRRRPIEGDEPLWPHGMLKLGMLLLLLLTIVLLLTGFLPPGLGDQAEATATRPVVALEWYLRPLAAFLALFPRSHPWIGGTLVLVLWLGLLLWPFLDRTDPEKPRGRRTLQLLRVMGVLLILAAFVLAFLPVR